MTAKKSAPAKATKATSAETEEKKKPGRPAAKTATEAKGKPGRKPKSAAAKEEVPEEDFSDIEADLAGEPEAEVADAGDGEKVVKAKPLRMKVSRAKERALMREFGLDETALTEE